VLSWQALRSAGRESKLVLFEIENAFARDRLYAKLLQPESGTAAATQFLNDLVILNPELVCLGFRPLALHCS